jgi:serine/threonine protein kinase
VREEELVGRVIDGRYRVEARIGRGGMGAVYRVRHTQSHESFALKVLHPQFAADGAIVERFVREARAAAAFRSKHVVKIIDAQREHRGPAGEPMPYLVMELLLGANLEAIVEARGPLPKEQVSWALRQVGKALDLAHARGIVHRDLKPENLFVAIDDEGEPVTKVCDFGIAKLVGEAAQGLLTTGALSTSASSLGTPMYMSPEQLRDASTVDAKTDQWAIGLIAFKALAGKEYFADARSSGELMARILADPIVSPSKKGLDLGEAFDAWFLRSCARAPEDRWPAVSAQIAALDAALGVTAPAPIPAPSTGVVDV